MFIFINASLAFAGPNRTTYQAKIVKPDGYPLEASSVNFKFTIMEPAGTCILYSETYSNVNMSSTGGMISFALGSGVKSYPASATTFEQVFSNITPALSCDAGGPPSYSPLSTDIRKIVMQFHDGAGWQTLPAMSINAVPYAMFANEAATLNGKTDAEFVEYAGLPTCLTTEALHFNGTSFSCLSTATASVSAAAVVAALGYTPAAGASVTAIASSLSTTDSTVASVSSTLFSVSSTVSSLSDSVTSLENTVAASFAAMTSSQWVTSGTAISYNAGSVSVSGSMRISMDAVSCSANSAGTLRYNAGVVEYCNGTIWSAFGVAGAGITLLNGSASGSQTFGTGINGTVFNISSVNGVHTFNIPLAASAGVTAGLVSNADFTYLTDSLVQTATSFTAFTAVQATNAASFAAVASSQASNAASFASVSNSLSTIATSFSTVANNQVTNAASFAAVASTQAINAASFAAITSSQWQASATTISYNAGRVGIGTSTPITLLDLTGDLGSGANLNIYNTNVTDGRATIRFRNDRTVTQQYEVGIDPGGSNSKHFAIRDLTASGAPVRMALTSSGNLGVGTVNPTERLSVSGNINITNPGASVDRRVSIATNGGGEKAYVRFDQTAAPGPNNYWDVGSLSGNNTYDFGFESSGTRRMTLTFGGNLGVGVQTPSAKLQLAAGNSSLAPFKLTSGSLTSSPASGAIEYDGSYYYITDGSNTRRAIATVATPGVLDASNITSPGNMTLTPTGSVVVSSTTSSTDSTTGALIINGGLGIAGNTFSSGTITTTSTMTASSVTATHLMMTPIIYGGTGVSGNLRLESTTNSTKGNIILAQGTGNVGIGNANAFAKLYVDGDGMSANSPAAGTVAVFDNESAAEMNISLFSTLNRRASIFFANTGAVSRGAINYDFSNTPSLEKLSFKVNSASTVVLDAYNRMGVGTSNPIATISLQNATDQGSLNIKAAPSQSSYWLRVQDSNDVTKLVITPNGSMPAIQLGTTNRISLTSEYGGIHEVPGGAAVNTSNNLSLINSGNPGIMTMAGYYNGAQFLSAWEIANVASGFGNLALMRSGGNVGVGVLASTAKLHIGSGSITVAPLKITSGTLLASPQSGTIEYDGFNYYITDGTNTRRSIATTTAAGSFDNVSTINNTSNITLVPTSSVVVSSTAASTNSATGALVVKGGLGVAGNINSSGTILTTSNIEGNGIKTKGTSAYLEMHDTDTLYSANPQSALVFRDSGNSQYSFMGPVNGVMTWNSWLPVEIDTTAGVDLYVSMAGRVGIGTSSTIAKLHVTDTNRALATETYNAMIATSDTQAQDIGASLALAGQFGSGSTPTAFASVSGRKENSTAGNYAGYLSFATRQMSTPNSDERMRITSTGNVGIGTASPAEKFVVNGKVILGGTSTFYTGASSFPSIAADAANASALILNGGSIANTWRIKNANGVLDFLTCADATCVGGTQYMKLNSAGLTVPGAVSFGASMVPGLNQYVFNGNASPVDLFAEPYPFGDNAGSDLYLRSGDASTGSTNKNGGTLRLASGKATGTGSSNIEFRTADSTNVSTKMYINGVGNVGIGTTAPTAKLHLAAGTTSNASLKITSGSLLSTPADGAIEYDGTSLYYTDSTNTRRALASNSGSQTNSANNSFTGVNTFTGATYVSNNTASTNSTTGALVVSGGVGVGGAINSAGAITSLSGISAVSNVLTNGYFIANQANTGPPTSGTRSVGTRFVLYPLVGPGLADHAMGIDTLATWYSVPDSSRQFQWYAGETPLMALKGNGNLGVGTVAPQAKLDVSGDQYIQGTNGINFHNGSYSVGSGIRELFRVDQSGLTTGGTFTLSATRGGFVHASQWAWSSTHNGTGKGVLTQLSSGQYSNIFVYLDVASNGSVIISADWGAAQAYSISVIKTAGASVVVSSAGADWATVNPGYSRVRSVSTISDGFQTVNATFMGNVGIGTNTPKGPFHIKPTAGSYASGSMILEDSSGSSVYGMINSSNNLYLGYNSNSGGAFPQADYQHRMVISSAGNVGIGMSSPASPLSVSGTGGTGNGPGVFSITATANNANVWASSAMDSELTAGNGILHLIGQAGSTNNSGYLAYRHTGSASATNYMAIGLYNNDNILNVTGAGRIGIGTTAPSYRLQVQKTASATPAIMIGGGHAGGPRLQTYGLDADANAWMGLGTDMSGNNYEHSIYTSGPGVNGKITFGQYDGNSFTERMRIHGDGNVGIGTNSPSSKFEIKGTVLGANLNDNFEMQRWYNSTGVNNSQLDVRHIRTSAGNTWLNSGMRIQQKIDATWMGYMQFNGTGNDAGISFGTGQTTVAPGNTIERLRITQTGYVGIGTTAPSEMLEVSGSVKATAYLYTSDERLKKEIITLPDALEKALKLRGVNFVWRNNNEKTVGFIAQEVEAVYPELVKTDKITGYKAVQYGNIVAILVEALKQENEQRVRSIANVEEKSATRMNQLEKENQELKARLEKIEKFLNDKVK